MRILWLPAILAGYCFNTFGFEKDATPAVPPAPLATYDASQPPPSNSSKPIALRIVGSTVKNLKGEYLGRIENVTLNPENKQIEFALLDMNYPTNNSRVTAVPWPLLNYVWDQGQVGGLPGAVQMFRLDVDKARLAQAPTLEKTQFASLMQPEFRQQLLGFYGNAVDYAVGASGNAGTVTTGTSASGATAAMPAQAGTYDPASAGAFPGSYATPDFVTVLTGTNTVASTNAATTTNSTSGSSQTNLFPGTLNPFPGGTNNFPGTTNAFPGGTNIFPGARATLAPSGTQTTPAQRSGATTTTPATPPAPGDRSSPWTPAAKAMVPVVPSTTTPGTSGQNPSGTSGAATVAPTQPPASSPGAPFTPTMPPAATPRSGAVTPRSTR